ncbi:hypothetical protein ACFXPS_29000 [Nocardia sp. NPDC059091]|uniref:hypothetical protein n=1 Tax=unclassified Nocardia TaxID=2637762 RepID=UPI0036A5B981
MNALADLVVVVLACVVVEVAVSWGISDNPSKVTSVHDETLLIADGRVFHRVPVGNLQRLHGRHRA